MKKIITLLLAATLIIFTSCGGSSDGKDKSSKAETAELSLKDKGIPVVLMAPKGATVSKGAGVTEMNGVKYKNFTIKATNFRLNASMPDADATETVAEAVKTQKHMSSKDEGFEIVKEENNGYIYKYTNKKGEAYKCVYVTIKDKRKITFTSMPPMSANHTLEQVQAMFDAAKSAK